MHDIQLIHAPRLDLAEARDDAGTTLATIYAPCSPHPRFHIPHTLAMDTLKQILLRLEALRKHHASASANASAKSS